MSSPGEPIGHCRAWRPESHTDRGYLDCGCGWGDFCDVGRADVPQPGLVVVVPEIPDCDFCQDGTLGPIDFRTRYGPWAHGCPDHWAEHRRFARLGVGFGQRWITPAQVAS